MARYSIELVVVRRMLGEMQGICLVGAVRSLLEVFRGIRLELKAVRNLI